MEDKDIIRRTYIGSTDISAIMELNPYETAWDVWNYKKNGVKKEFTPEQQERMNLGLALENAILDYGASKYGMKILDRQQRFTHSQFEFLGGTPDAIARYENEHLFDIAYIIDAKNANEFTKNFENSENEAQVPEYYYMQQIWNMGLSGAHSSQIWRLIGGSKFKAYEINFDKPNQMIFETALGKAVEFWNRFVLGDEEPERKELSNQIFYKGAKKFADKSILPVIEQLKEFKKRKKELEEQEELMTAMVKDYMGEYEILVDENDKKLAICNKISSMRLDNDLVKKELGERLPQFQKESVYRALRIA